MSTYSKSLTIRCTPEQIKMWTAKSKEFDLSINQFMRLAANTLIYTERPILARYIYGNMGTVKEPRTQKILNEEK